MNDHVKSTVIVSGAAVQIDGPPWTPSRPASQWTKTTCGAFDPEPVWEMWDRRAARPG